jgi:glucokinase
MPKLGWIGIDVGGTKTRFDLFDEGFRRVQGVRVKTPREADQFQTELTTVVSRLMKTAAPRLIVSGIGVGFAGRIDTAKGIVLDAPNLPALAGFSFKKALADFTADVIVYNDVHAAMYGELKLGAANGRKHVLGVFIGTGIGGAIVSNGKLHLGASGLAGNIGNYMLQPFGPLAGSERHGVLDEVASRVAIAGAAASLALKNWAPNLLKNAGTDVRRIKSSDLAGAIRAGDKAIEELVRSRAHIVGIVLSNLVDFFNPEMVVLGGGLTDAMPKMIRDEVAAGIKAHSTAEARKGLQVVTTKLKGHAVTAGAAKLASEATP